MNGVINFTIDLSMTLEDLHLLREAVLHYRSTHSGGTGPAISRLHDTLRTLSERAERASLLLDTPTSQPEPSMLTDAKPKPPSLGIPFDHLQRALEEAEEGKNA